MIDTDVQNPGSAEDFMSSPAIQDHLIDKFNQLPDCFKTRDEQTRELSDRASATVIEAAANIPTGS